MNQLLSSSAAWFRSRPMRQRAALTGSVVLCGVLFAGYIQLSRFVESKLHDGGIGAAALFYSAPRLIASGDEMPVEAIATELRAAGYTESDDNTLGTFSIQKNAIAIRPGRDSYFRSEPVMVQIANGSIAKVTALSTGRTLDSYALEPQPLAAMADGTMQRCRPVKYADIPKPLVQALLSVEDKHFFNHVGFDPARVLKAAWVNGKSGRKQQGGSTLTMQLARNLYLSPDKTWKRKLTELVIAEVLELKLTKEQILEYYVNQVYLGRRDAMSLRGFGQAANTYFGKDLKDVSLAEAAALAGLVQRPSYFDPVRHPERITTRRNLVLALMHQNGYITEQQMAEAAAEPVVIAPRSAGAHNAPWFVDLAANELEDHEDREGQERVYTTLDPDLQRAAVASVAKGMALVDARLTKKKAAARPQVALVALDSHTGEIKALVGGRDFGVSQLNHVLAARQPGSVFKPFVYAAALSSERMTLSTTVLDQPTTFQFEGQAYTPSNHGDHFYGRVTLRNALAKSMNIAAVSVAEQAGYAKILNMAHAAGLSQTMKATPALALGAYESTPLAMAASYTAFANSGVYVKPSFIAEVRDTLGAVTYAAQPASNRVMEPGVAFLMQDMLTEVVRSGTAASVQSSGLRAPAAGKTGTSRDGWFVGYASNLICLVWVGFDDNTDLDLEGAKSALPIWTEFMKHAAKRTAYRQDLGSAPSNVVRVSVDASTGLRAGPDCPNTR